MLNTFQKGHHFVDSLLVRIESQCHCQFRWVTRHEPEPVQTQPEKTRLCELHVCVGEILGQDGDDGQWLAFLHGLDRFTRSAPVRRWWGRLFIFEMPAQYPEWQDVNE